MGVISTIWRGAVSIVLFPFKVVIVVGYCVGWFDRKVIARFTDGPWRNAGSRISQKHKSFTAKLGTAILTMFPLVVMAWFIFYFELASGPGFMVVSLVFLIALFPYHRWLEFLLSSGKFWFVLIFTLIPFALAMVSFGAVNYWLLFIPEITSVLKSIAIISMIYGALLMLASQNFESFVASFITSNSGFYLLFILFASKITGNLAKIGLFFTAALVVIILFQLKRLQKQSGSARIAKYSGLRLSMPKWSLALVALCYLLSGMPGSLNLDLSVLLSEEIGGNITLLMIIHRVLVAVAFGWFLIRILAGSYSFAGDRTAAKFKDTPWVMLIFIMLFFVFNLLFAAPSRTLGPWFGF